ncbi:hypothetical protein BV25DRAFT_817486 [Artomyces pyxidatus]|uniref:Uncharacterized protein n=1 Tax=Artomyces pyxidatus TaxID=48021 RepID=A0ACB8SYL3_9AGAM|nr:hypothetical protein BV25DRAFT_817486 [Artomyces pyxidatus]
MCNAVTSDDSYRIVLDWAVLNRTVRVIPQRRWMPYDGGRRGLMDLKIADVVPPLFSILSEGTLGVRLTEAASAVDDTLRDGSWAPLAGRPSIKLRLSLHDYKPIEKQIQLRDRASSQPITLAKLLTLVANCLLCYIQDIKSNPALGNDCPDWAFRSWLGEISPASLFVVGVVGVSGGSLTPILEVRN